MGKTQKLRLFQTYLEGLSNVSTKLTILRDTIRTIAKKFKYYGTATNLPSHGIRKPKISSRALNNFQSRQLRTTVLQTYRWSTCPSRSSLVSSVHCTVSQNTVASSKFLIQILVNLLVVKSGVPWSSVMKSSFIHCTPLVATCTSRHHVIL